MFQKNDYCIDTISSGAPTNQICGVVSRRPTGMVILSLWQQTLIMTTVWLSSGIASLTGHLFLFLERSKQRKALSALDGHLLEDIGVDRLAAAHEAQKSFWQK
jgi:uncharacterized protein YjiS (DUF1127 family)